MTEIKFRIWDSMANVWVENADEMKVAILNDHASYHHIMQFTGLLDKEGVEIYEGDIIQYMYRSWNDGGMGDRLERKVVEFQNGSFNCFTEDSFGYEVIGNIYENPELLVSTDTKGEEDD